MNIRVKHASPGTNSIDYESRGGARFYLHKAHTVTIFSRPRLDRNIIDRMTAMAGLKKTVELLLVLVCLAGFPSVNGKPLLVS